MPYLEFFSALRDTVTSFAVSGGYITLFIVLFLEGIPLIGIAIPGHIALLSAGFLIATGIFDPYIVFIVTFFAAVSGDYLSFLLGRFFGWKFIERFLPYFFISESVILKAKKFLEAHTGKALILGRFNPVTRGLMPFFVGSNKLPYKHFSLWNSVGAFIWVAASLTAGYLLGLGFHVATGWFSKALVIGIAFVIVSAWSYRFVNGRFHIFRRYELFMLILNIVSLLVLIRMVDDALQIEPFMAAFDLYVNSVALRVAETNLGTYVSATALWLSALGGKMALSILTVVFGVTLAYKRRWRSVVIVLLSMGSTAVIVTWAKDIFQRVRPMDLYSGDLAQSLSFFLENINESLGPSFPSGHAAFAAAFFTIMAYLLTPRIRSWVKRELFIVLCAVFILAIGLSRIVLSVHWASDVIAGWALGIFCATASILFVRYIGALLMKNVNLGEPLPTSPSIL